MPLSLYRRHLKKRPYYQQPNDTEREVVSSSMPDLGTGDAGREVCPPVNATELLGARRGAG